VCVCGSVGMWLKVHRGAADSAPACVISAPQMSSGILMVFLNIDEHLYEVKLSEQLRLTVFKLRSFNLLKTNRRPLYLKIQTVPRSKHFSSRL